MSKKRFKWKHQSAVRHNLARSQRVGGLGGGVGGVRRREGRPPPPGHAPVPIVSCLGLKPLPACMEMWTLSKISQYRLYLSVGEVSVAMPMEACLCSTFKTLPQKNTERFKYIILRQMPFGHLAVVFSTFAYGSNSYHVLKGNSHMISPDRTRLISILLSNSRLPGHLSPDLWHWMLIILILLIHATTRQQWNASWQSKRWRSAQILSTAIVTVALATRTGMKRVGTRPDGRRCHVPVWKRWNTASYIYSVLGCSFKYEDRRRIFRLGSFCLNSTK